MRRRQGFTLVELLVSMALILFMMAILSQAFISATGVFRNLKAAGDMAEKLRAVTQLLQRDLAADHFEGKKRLSDPQFWIYGPPQQGFFQILQGSAGTAESIVGDTSGINSYRSTDHSLAFTIKLRGNQMSDFLSASGGMAALSNTGIFGPPEARYQSTSGGSYNYQWATVDWFLLPSTNPATGQQDMTAPDPATGAAPIPLYTLYRRQRLLVPDNNLVPPQSAANTSQFFEVSYWQPPGQSDLYFNNPTDITVPERRVLGITSPYAPLPTVSGTLYGSDIQLTDVVSFDVRILTTETPRSVDPFGTLFQPPFTTGYTYTPPTWYTQGKAFDTWSRVNDGFNDYSQWNLPLAQQKPQIPGTTIPFWRSATTQTLNGTPHGVTILYSHGPIIQALQISIRIWDTKTNQTRQVTIVQAM